MKAVASLYLVNYRHKISLKKYFTNPVMNVLYIKYYGVYVKYCIYLIIAKIYYIIHASL